MRNKHAKQESLARIWILKFKSPTDKKKNISMSKRNNSKTEKQEITQELLHAMAKRWFAGNEHRRAVVLFSLSENDEISANILGERRKLDNLLYAKSISALLRAYRKPSLWQRIRDWFFPFNIK